MSNSKLEDVSLPFGHFPGEGAEQRASAREVPVKQAKAKLTELLRAAEAGERIVLTRHGKPVADLVPHQEANVAPMSIIERVKAWKEMHGYAGVKGWVADDFDEQLPEDFLLQPFPEDFDERLAAREARFRKAD